MYFGDHNPPHFHVRYGAQRALIDIDRLAVLRGKLSPRALGLVVEWGLAHRPELRDNWRRARALEALLPIDPLE